VGFAFGDWEQGEDMAVRFAKLMAQSPSLRRFAFPIFAVIIATVARYDADPLLGTRAPLLFYVLAVAVVAQISGTVSGLIATGLSVVSIRYFFIPPIHSFRPPDFADHMALLLFVCVGVVLSIYGGREKRTKDELVEARYLLETAQHIANIGSWDSNLVTNALRWSPETYLILGFPVGTILHSEDFYECIPPDERDTVRAAVANAIETETYYDSEHHIVRKNDGEIRLVHYQAKIIRDDSGNSVHLVGSIRDITEKKRGEMAQQILGGLIKVCSSCRRIRDPRDDDWYSMEAYLRKHAPVEFSHGMCTDCARQWYGKERKEATS
jgi:PAS domain S-box-containing protein